MFKKKKKKVPFLRFFNNKIIFEDIVHGSYIRVLNTNCSYNSVPGKF